MIDLRCGEDPFRGPRAQLIPGIGRAPGVGRVRARPFRHRRDGVVEERLEGALRRGRFLAADDRANLVIVVVVRPQAVEPGLVLDLEGLVFEPAGPVAVDQDRRRELVRAPADRGRRRPGELQVRPGGQFRSREFGRRGRLCLLRGTRFLRGSCLGRGAGPEAVDDALVRAGEQRAVGHGETVDLALHGRLPHELAVGGPICQHLVLAAEEDRVAGRDHAVRRPRADVPLPPLRAALDGVERVVGDEKSRVAPHDHRLGAAVREDLLLRILEIGDADGQAPAARSARNAPVAGHHDEAPGAGDADVLAAAAVIAVEHQQPEPPLRGEEVLLRRRERSLEREPVVFLYEPPGPLGPARLCVERAQVRLLPREHRGGEVGRALVHRHPRPDGPEGDEAAVVDDQPASGRRAVPPDELAGGRVNAVCVAIVGAEVEFALVETWRDPHRAAGREPPFLAARLRIDAVHGVVGRRSEVHAAADDDRMEHGIVVPHLRERGLPVVCIPFRRPVPGRLWRIR